jgi:hypothetical protein
LTDKQFLTFQRIIVFYLYGQKAFFYCSTLKLKAVHSFPISGTVCPTKHYNNSENFSNMAAVVSDLAQ